MMGRKRERERERSGKEKKKETDDFSSSTLQERLEKEDINSEKRAARWIARSDRPWFQLVSFLLGVVIVLLVLIAYRINLVIYLDYLKK